MIRNPYRYRLSMVFIGMAVIALLAVMQLVGGGR